MRDRGASTAPLDPKAPEDPDVLRCLTCGAPLGTDPDDNPTGDDDDPTGDDGGPICGECDRNRNFDV